MKRLVLVGGGHGHLFALESLARTSLPDVEVVLVTPSRWQYYSGMLPGFMTGRFSVDDIRIDLEPLARGAGARLLLQPMTAMRANQNCICLADGTHLDYDLLSLDTGAETDDSWLIEAGDRLLNIKPLPQFVERWGRFLSGDSLSDGGPLAIVGAGAGGVELAIAAAEALQRPQRLHPVTLIAGPHGPLKGFPKSAVSHVEGALRAAGVEVIRSRAAAEDGQLVFDDAENLCAELIIGSTGIKPPVWLYGSQLLQARDAFVATQSNLRSTSHTNVFAVGDVATRVDVAVAKSGVHAVRAGPILAHNLVAAIRKRPMRDYIPRKTSLYILTTGRGRAVAVYGQLVVEGRRVLAWKDRIDRAFIRRFSYQR